jgi:hypothetical protein
MNKVARSEILDFVTYVEQRDELRPGFLEAKRVRRIQHKSVLTLLFENQETVRYQVQEMMRVEQIIREADIQHELDTYNELLGKTGELGCTLLIGLEDEQERDAKLTAWEGLLPHLCLVLEDGSRVGASWDPRQVGRGRLSSVQYLKFDTGGVLPTALAVDFPDPDLEGETRFTDEQREALAADLS